MVWNKLTVKKMLTWLPEDGCLIVFNGSNARWAMEANPRGLKVSTLDKDQKYMKLRDLMITRR